MTNTNKKENTMRIDSHKVSFFTTHSSFKSTSLTENYFNFQNSLDQNQLSNINEITTNPKGELSSDYVINELTKAIMRNLFILRQRAKIYRADISFSAKEYEAMNFQTKATIYSGDRAIEVDINLTMQRSFTQQISLNSVVARGVFADPLVVSLDDNMPSLSEKSFSFDIDSDGKRDQISLLGKNSAFLALDKDKSGNINSADELFGAKSGDGFEDLRVYDEDGNNWIDENDKIFHRLRIWKKNEDEDRLLALGEVGIGAIFLGNTKTPFSINTTNTNTPLGLMRSSSFFVKEGGSSGIMSQIDLAIQNNKQGSLQEALSLFGDKSSKLFSSKKKRKSVLNVLKEYIKQLEVALIKSSDSEKEMVQNKIVALREKIKSLEV